MKFCCKNQPNNGTAKSLSAEKLERRIRPDFRKICERKSHIFVKIYLFFYFCLKHQQNNEKNAMHYPDRRLKLTYVFYVIIYVIIYVILYEIIYRLIFKLTQSCRNANCAR